MVALLLSSQATMYVQISVQATVGGAPIDPTADAVQMAFIPTRIGGAPTSGDWHTATWTTVAAQSYIAQCLVGPTGGVNLPIGEYVVWLKITDTPETPVAATGYLVITT